MKRSQSPSDPGITEPAPRADPTFPPQAAEQPPAGAEARREQILDMATTVFAQHGYRQTDVQVIADRIGVGKGTIYRYFPTKRDLFLQTVDRGIRRLSECVAQAADAQADPLRQLEAAVFAYCEYFDKYPEVIELLIVERGEFKQRMRPTYFVYCDANIGRWRDLFNDLIDEGRIRPVPVESTLNVINDTLYGMIFTNHFAGRRKPLKFQAADILDVIYHGILAHEPGEAPCRKATRS